MKLKKVGTAVLAFAAAFFLAGKAKAETGFGLENVKLKDVNKANAALATPKAANAAMPQKEWTVMVYMNAKNNLEKFANKDLDEMASVGTTNKVNIVVEVGMMSDKITRRMLINKKPLLSGAKHTIYSETPNSDMGDYKNTAAFMQWAKETFPAKHYMFILWNHGLGWYDPKMNKDGTGDKGISFDDVTKNYIRTKQIAAIFQEAGRVDVFASNACLMQMAEVLYETKDSADVLIGSEETMLAFGYDYKKLLSYLNAYPDATPFQIGENFVMWYKQFFEEGAPIFGPITMPLDKIGMTLSAVNPQALDKLPGELKAWSDTVMANNEVNAVKYAVEKAVRFGPFGEQDKDKQLTTYGDLGHFVTLIAERAENDSTRTASARLLQYLDKELVVAHIGKNTDSVGDDYSNTHGVAIQMTSRSKKGVLNLDAMFESRYSDLSLPKASGWDKFVDWTNSVWLKQ